MPKRAYGILGDLKLQTDAFKKHKLKPSKKNKVKPLKKKQVNTTKKKPRLSTNAKRLAKVIGSLERKLEMSR